MGVGRYSCHCNHSSEISLLGFTSKCSCVEEVKKKDPNHHCICGAHLETKEPRKDDCCSVKYFRLDTDHNSSSDYFIISILVTPAFLPVETIIAVVSPVLAPKIKTFQALFHRVTESLVEKSQQLNL